MANHHLQSPLKWLDEVGPRPVYKSRCTYTRKTLQRTRTVTDTKHTAAGMANKRGSVARRTCRLAALVADKTSLIVADVHSPQPRSPTLTTCSDTQAHTTRPGRGTARVRHKHQRHASRLCSPGRNHILAHSSAARSTQPHNQDHCPPQQSGSPLEPHLLHLLPACRAAAPRGALMPGKGWPCRVRLP